MMRRARFVGVATAMLVVALGAAPAAAQLPVNATPLPGTFSHMVVDAATSHVFVSITSSGKIVVLNFDGDVVETISGESGARGLAVVGSHLYVVAAGGNAIDDIDTGTLTKSATLTTGLHDASDLVATSGALWVVDASNFVFPKLVRVATADGTQTRTDNPGGPYGTGLAGDPADDNTLVEYTPPQILPMTMTRVDLSADPPAKVVQQVITSPEVDGAGEVAVTPDGQHVVPAGTTETPFKFVEFNMSDFTASGLTYGANPTPTAVAMTSAAGGLFAGGLAGYGSDHDVVVYHLGDGSAPISTHSFTTVRTTSIVPHGLAFSPNGQRLFAVTDDIDEGAATFHVLTLSGSPAPVKRVSVSPSSVPFGHQRVGTYGPSKTFTVKNIGTVSISLQQLTIAGSNPYDFFGTTDCLASGNPRTLGVGASCHVVLYFAPLKFGARHATLVVKSTASYSTVTAALSGTGTEGYLIGGAFGEVGNFGDAGYFGDATKQHLKAPITTLVATPNGEGYWLLALDGGIFGYGNAKFYGSTGSMKLNKPIVSMARTPNGRGYWLIGSDGGIFGYGDAHYHGSTARLHLLIPIVGMAATPDGKGYWLVTADGSVYGFGDAHNMGSARGRVHGVVRQIVGSPSGHGYWLATTTGQVFNFGDARYLGSAPGQPVVGIAATPSGKGYWLATRNAVIFPYGDARFFGDLRAYGITDVIGIAGSGPPLPPDLLKFGAGRSRIAG
jgi:hypothetical protein